MKSVVAIDIGGVNLKAIRADGSAATLPFKLAQTPELLIDRLRELIFPRATSRKTQVSRLTTQDSPELLLTMSGELCDCFASRVQGVRWLLGEVERFAQGASVRVWSTQGRFVSVDQAMAQPMHVGSANWHGLATWMARQFAEEAALLLDMGSTTTDIVPLSDGRVVAAGLTDATRLAGGELVYIGAAATPLMALATRVKLGGTSFGVMAEPFATLGDVLVLAGLHLPRPHDTDTPDGRPMTMPHAAARVLRMIGGDLETHAFADALALARTFLDAAMERLVDAVRQAAQRLPGPVQRVIVSGSGEALVLSAAAIALMGSSVEVTRLSEMLGEEISAAACAYALLPLAASAGD